MEYGPNLLGNQVSDGSPFVIGCSPNPQVSAYLAFDAAGTGTWWASAVGSTDGWLSVDFGVGNAKIVAKYEHTLYPEQNHCPDNWTFEGSNDNSNWDVLDTRTGQAQFYGTVKAYAFANSTSYRYYRINISKVGGTLGDVVIGINNLTMHEALFLPSPFPTFHRA